MTGRPPASVVCAGCDREDRWLLSLNLSAYKPGRNGGLFRSDARQYVHAGTFKVCLDCVRRWLRKGSKSSHPALRRAFRKALREIYDRLAIAET